jgi:hypothetical protein
MTITLVIRSKNHKPPSGSISSLAQNTGCTLSERHVAGAGPEIEQGKIEQGRVEQGRVEQGRVEQGRVEQGKVEQGKVVLALRGVTLDSVTLDSVTVDRGEHHALPG